MASVSPVPASPHASEHDLDHEHDLDLDHDSDMDQDDHDDDHDVHTGLPRDPVAAGILPPPRQRACASCARLKIKCGWPKADAGAGTASVSDGRPCIRCARLKIKCQIPDRVKRKKKIRTTRVSQLEEKIDGIVNLLAAHNATSQTSPPSGATGTASSKAQAHPTPPTASTNAATSIAALLSNPNNAKSPSQDAVRPAPPKLDENTKWVFPKNPVLPSPVSHASPDSAGSDSFAIELSPTMNLTVTASQATRYLTLYDDEYVPTCPLVTPLSAEMMLNPASLHASAPLLFWSVIATVAPLDGPTQVTFRRWFRSRAADYILISPMPPAHPDHRATGLAVLQAILVHAAWCDNHGFVDSHVTSLLHLALALVADLRLDRPHVFKDAVAKNLIKDACSTMTIANRPTHSFPVAVGLEERTLAECRAVVGFYCLASVLFQRTGHPMSHSPAITHFTKALLNANEFPTDRLLVAISQMVAAVEPVVYGPLSRDRISDPHSTIEFTEPIHMVIQQAKREVDAVAESYDESVTSQIPFRFFYLGTVIRLYEPVIAVRALPSTMHARATILWNVLVMAETVLETFGSLPPPSYTVQPITTMISVGPAMMSMARLLLLDFPFPAHTAAMAELARGWDAAAARNRFNFVDITGRIIEAMEKVEDVSLKEGRKLRVLAHGGSALGSGIEKMKWIRRWFYAKLHGQRRMGGGGGGAAAEDGKADSEDGGGMSDQQTPMPPHQRQQPLHQHQHQRPQAPQYQEQQQHQPYEQQQQQQQIYPPTTPYARPPSHLQPHQQQQFDPQAQSPYQFYTPTSNTSTPSNTNTTAYGAAAGGGGTNTTTSPMAGIGGGNGAGAAAAAAAAAAGTSDFALSWLEGLGLGAGAVDLSGMDPNFFQTLMDDIMMGVPQAGFSGV